MSEISGRAGERHLTWLTAPRGRTGTAQLRLGPRGEKGKVIEVRWLRDGHGLWLELPDGVHGFNFEGEAGDDGRTRYRVSERVGDGEWIEQAFIRAGEDSAVASGAAKKKGLRIRAQMPGRVLRIMAKAGDQVAKGQALLVMEAMKMENEIKAPADARVLDCKAKEGQAVESGADLLLLEPS
jgi:3-methylcrotonyl-CoA carboxylase alpha subunit